MVDKLHSIGAQGAIWATMGAEAVNVIFDLRWMLVLSVILILTDFWWGYSEYKYHRAEAVRHGDKAAAKKYTFRFSRAGRRSMNKLIDYLTYLLIGSITGVAVFEPLGICSHVVTAAVGVGFGCLFDVSSIIGHVCVVHGIEPPHWSIKGVLTFLGRVAASFVRRKNEDAGEALEEVVTKYEKSNEKGNRDNSSHYEIGEQGNGDTD